MIDTDLLKYLEASQSDDDLYFIQMGKTNYIKIGRSNNPKRRFKSFTFPEESKIILIKQKLGGIENILHKLFLHLRKNQEWFTFTDTEIELIKNDQLDLLISFYKRRI